MSFAIIIGMVATADAQNTQRARQDREYKSLSNATQRAFAPSKPSPPRPTTRR
jgi:hypothetical protein